MSAAESINRELYDSERLAAELSTSALHFETYTLCQPARRNQCTAR